VPAYVFNLGIKGDDSSFVLMVSKNPGELAKYIGNAGQAPDDPVSDLRRITYMMVPGKGLARQEETNVTYADVSTITAPPTVDGEPTIIASAVQSMKVQYYGSTSSTGSPDWQDTWDGTTIDTTTSFPIGPPAAIAITLTIQMPSSSKNEEGRKVTIRHVVAIQAANRWVTASSGQGTGQ